MESLAAPHYWLARFVLERLLAGLYVIAFATVVTQFRPLLGERGLLPAPRFLAEASFREAPSLFHLRYSDRLVTVVGWIGVALAASIVAGIPQRGPLWVPALVWLVLWALYLSIVNVGQRFYGFGWESLLLETGLLAVFFGNARTAPSLIVVFAIRWLLFRLEVGAGLIKLRGDRCWRDLTCLYYHHETQPMPNPLSWYFHHLPKPLHKVEVLGNFFAQLVVPFGLFAPQPIASIAGAVLVVTQSWLLVSGNFAWLNALTLTLAVASFDDGTLGRIVTVTPPALEEAPLGFAIATVVLGVVVIVLSYWPVRNLLSADQAMNRSFNPFHFVNTYGAFGSITRVRHEVIIEGTSDPSPGETTEWKAYELVGKPGDPRHRPPQIAPYHLRLDWLLWFAALSPGYAADWFVALLVKLLENDRAVIGLFRNNPFPDAPPRFVRARYYRYRFSTWGEKRETGAWWVRTLVGDYAPAIRLREAPSPERRSADELGEVNAEHAFSFRRSLPRASTSKAR